MRKIFLAPRSNETAYKNYVSSMQGKKFEDIEPYLTSEEAAELAGDDKYFVWGCQPSLKGRWDKLEHGDFVMFYSQQEFISVGSLKFKKMSKELALKLWPKSKESGEPWSCVFFVENIQEISLPLAEFNKITGYELRQVQGFMKLTRDTALDSIQKKYGSIEGFIDALAGGINEKQTKEIIEISQKSRAAMTREDIAKLDDLTREKSNEEVEAAIARYRAQQHNKTPEQVTRLVKAYKRNVGMVREIKKKFKNECQICGFTFRTAKGGFYSEAAHVIPISDAKQGVDSPDNIWILCANHHKMLDAKAIEAVGNHSYLFDGKRHDLLVY